MTGANLRSGGAFHFFALFRANYKSLLMPILKSFFNRKRFTMVPNDPFGSGLLNANSPQFIETYYCTNEGDQTPVHSRRYLRARNLCTKIKKIVNG